MAVACFERETFRAPITVDPWNLEQCQAVRAASAADAYTCLRFRVGSSSPDLLGFHLSHALILTRWVTWLSNVSRAAAGSHDKPCIVTTRTALVLQILGHVLTAVITAVPNVALMRSPRFIADSRVVLPRSGPAGLEFSQRYDTR